MVEPAASSKRHRSDAPSAFTREVYAESAGAVPEAGVWAMCSANRLEQVLGNLLENAVKYSPDGSEIMVKVEMKGEEIVTSVCDRGIGIPSDEVARVFERFHRGRQVSSTNYGGLGLGLFIAKTLLERSGATFSANNMQSPPGGAAVGVSWPRIVFQGGTRKPAQAMRFSPANRV